MLKEYPKNNNYLVSENGEIFSKRFNKKLTPKVNWDGYFRIQIWKNNKCKFVSWHRVVAETFIPNPNNLPCVNHKDGNKQNNSVDNLEWCSQSENIKHAWETGLSTKENHSKYGKVAHFDSNGNLIKIYQCPSVASEESGANYFTILNSAKKKTKSKNGYWRFIENCNDYPEREYATY